MALEQAGSRATSCSSRAFLKATMPEKEMTKPMAMAASATARDSR
jgi:hypothetical protein